MESKSIKNLIVDNYSNMNKLEKQVAKKVLDNPKNIVHMSISEVAIYCDVSDTTVFRFCNRLGFKGFQEFKINLALGIVTPMENIHGDIKEEDDSYIVMQKILKSVSVALEKTISDNSSELVETISKHVVKAKKICFWGNGGSGILASDAYHKFYRLGLNVEQSSDLHWQYMQASLLEPNDVVFAFSSSGSNKDLLEVLDYAHKKSAIVVAITQFLQSPISKKADILLYSYGYDQEFRSEAMESRLSALLIMDCIFIRCSMLMQPDSIDSLNNIREGIAKRRV